MRAPVVITTTVHANADELQVSTTIEENTGDASASGCRLSTLPQSIASNLAKPQSAHCEELDRSHLHLAHRGGPEVGTGTGPYTVDRQSPYTVTVGRPSVVWLCGQIVRVSHALGCGFLERSKRPWKGALHDQSEQHTAINSPPPTSSVPSRASGTVVRW